MFKAKPGRGKACSWQIAMLAALLLSVAGPAAAQDYDTTVVDEIEMETPVEREAGILKFDTIAESDRSTVQPRNVTQKDVEKLKSEDDFWYADEAPKRAKPKAVKREVPSESIFAQAWFGYLMWSIIVGGFVAILVWFLMSGNVRLYQKKAPQIITEKEELNTENIFDIDYETEIDKAISHKNYRLAIRLYYLNLLKELAQKSIINYKQERTNSDYVLQLSATGYYKEFFNLTRNFEYAWYGQFPVSEEVFQSIRGGFQTFKNKLPQ
ncbi:MAG TPA: hypothetical protein VEY06_14575 [Flavisolibacter sp.]|nr:hypothetical protein [Flavisolibacter sp.]